MIAFKILDNNNVPITLKTLDEEACLFWNKELKPKEYCNPSPEFSNPDKLTGREYALAELNYLFHEQKINWYDMIGFAIATQENNTWKSVIENILSSRLLEIFIPNNDNKFELISFEEKQTGYFSLPKNVETNLYSTLLYYKPYIELIEHWNSKGYKPICVKKQDY